MQHRVTGASPTQTPDSLCFYAWYPPLSALYTGICFYLIQITASLMGSGFQKGLKFLTESVRANHTLTSNLTLLACMENDGNRATFGRLKTIMFNDDR